MATDSRFEFDKGDLLDILSNDLLVRLLGVTSLVAGWWYLASIFPNELMPFPVETLTICWELLTSGSAAQNIIPTTYRSVQGFIGAALVGTTVGVLMGLSSYWRDYFNPMIVFLFTTPGILAAAIFALIVGFNDLAIFIAVTVVCTPIIAVPIWKTVEGFDRDLLRMSRSFDVPRTVMVKDFLIPTIMPAISSSYRFGFAISWKIVVTAELFAAQDGVGRQIVETWGAYLFEETFAWVVFFAIIILSLEYGFFAPIERRVFKYRREHDFDILAR